MRTTLMFCLMLALTPLAVSGSALATTDEIDRVLEMEGPCNGVISFDCVCNGNEVFCERGEPCEVSVLDVCTIGGD